MDMFLLFVVIFLCVALALGISALALSLLFRLMVRLSGQPGPSVGVPPAPASSPAAPPV
ncbi:MAG TPA: hypothetical protein VNL37_07510 [Candidatus Polarisedimenticolia bacterium]|nr:hypothetical protein [Candidatus Polarisedimenticolia bacterium]